MLVMSLIQIEEYQIDIAEKEKHLAKLQEQEKTLIQTFTGSIGDNNKFKEFILKVRGELQQISSSDWMYLLVLCSQVFRKKIKRVKRKSEVGEVLKEGEEEEEEEEENEEDTDSDDIRCVSEVRGRCSMVMRLQTEDVL